MYTARCLAVGMSACLAAATKPLSSLFIVPPSAATVPMGQPITGNVLVGTQIPTNAAANVTSFSVAGTSRVIPTNQGPTTLTDGSGKAVGTLALKSDGSYTFLPAHDFLGPVPAINLYAESTDGQTALSSLTLDVLPGACMQTCAGLQHAADTQL